MKILNILILLSIFSFANDITVTIKYNNQIPDKIIKTTYEDGMTAMNLLKKVSDVKATKAGKFLFVRSVDGVKSQVGKFGWFYTVNNKSTNKMASNYVLKDANKMTWSLKVSSCY
ncbi:MAG: DUF4430 domain-containing protein [Arcobacteraceae bacterium]|nr:DUF4430 domain-containing protein [Arcobacteraceae bacterium]